MNEIGLLKSAQVRVRICLKIVLIAALIGGCSKTDQGQMPADKKAGHLSCSEPEAMSRSNSSSHEQVIAQISGDPLILAAKATYGIKPEVLLGPVLDFYEKRRYSESDRAAIIQTLLKESRREQKFAHVEGMVVIFDPTCSVCYEKIEMIYEAIEFCRGDFPRLTLVPAAPPGNAVAKEAVEFLGRINLQQNTRYEDAVREVLAILPSNSHALTSLRKDYELENNNSELVPKAEMPELWSTLADVSVAKYPAIYLDGVSIDRYQGDSGHYFDSFASTDHLVLVIQLQGVVNGKR